MKSIVSILLLMGLLARALVSNAQTNNAPVTLADSTNLGDYTGVYTFASGSPVQKFTVSVEKGILMGEADSYGKNKLLMQAKSDTYKSTSSYGSIITFVRDPASKDVTGLTLATQGTELLAKKDKP